MKNPNTVFLTATNWACNIISQFCIETMFQNQPIDDTIVDGNDWYIQKWSYDNKRKKVL